MVVECLGWAKTSSGLCPLRAIYKHLYTDKPLTLLDVSIHVERNLDLDHWDSRLGWNGRAPPVHSEFPD